MNLDMRHANLAIKENGKLEIKQSNISAPSVYRLGHKLNGTCVFTKLDMQHSIHQMLLGKKSWELTNFCIHDGIYCFKQLVLRA